MMTIKCWKHGEVTEPCQTCDCKWGLSRPDGSAAYLPRDEEGEEFILQSAVRPLLEGLKNVVADLALIVPSIQNQVHRHLLADVEQEARRAYGRFMSQHKENHDNPPPQNQEVRVVNGYKSVDIHHKGDGWYWLSTRKWGKPNGPFKSWMDAHTNAIKAGAL